MNHKALHLLAFVTLDFELSLNSLRHTHGAGDINTENN
jgi:hypothetical protein